MKLHRHHLLEIILWPNEDGTLRTIHNSAKRLSELGIYDDFKMTIQITDSEHMRLHMLNEAEEVKTKRRHDSYGFKGKHHSSEHKQYMSTKLTGRHHSEEAKQKMRDAWVRRRQAKESKCQT